MLDTDTELEDVLDDAPHGGYSSDVEALAFAFGIGESRMKGALQATKGAEVSDFGAGNFSPVEISGKALSRLVEQIDSQLNR
ncbi:hypothetical protein [Salinibacter altiplanensis]|uniref:hypothetical protein n=1 Tax=Salinibacter altiplanensis TaxID=1803181 RepID=UPI000C9FC60D|nr:hypothetical protein [Salinibacter altiplanensis]